MTFRARNAYYLRISTHVVLPLFLYLDERHIDWMSDIVLQHVLADLRPLIIPKLQAEKDVHFGPGATPGSKRGTVEVHRGETYQFAYFFRKTEPHTVLFKSRYFVTASPHPKAAPNIPARLASRHSQRKNLRSRVPDKRKRAKSQGRDKNSESRLDGDEWFAEESEEDMDADPIEREPRPVRKQRRITADATQEDDEQDVDVAMDSAPPEMDGGSVEKPNVHSPKDCDSIALDANDQPSDSDMVDIELIVEEEENKPKPLLKLKYQSFPISGHCLCVVVEPWPSLHAETRLPARLGSSRQYLGLERAVLPSNAPVISGQREGTPLFLLEYDRAPSEVPFARESTLPTMPQGDDYSDDDLMTFSQALNATGHMHAIAADDEDDMDGAVLFGDADEVREF